MKKFTNLKDAKSQSTDTLIGADTSIEGKVYSNASLRIDGSIRGNITCKGDLYIGEQAVLHSDITAANVYHAGKIHGTVTTSGTLFMAESGKIFGDLEVAKIQITEGAVFEGTIIMKHVDEAAKSVAVQQKHEKVKVAK